MCVRELVVLAAFGVAACSSSASPAEPTSDAGITPEEDAGEGDAGPNAELNPYGVPYPTQNIFKPLFDFDKGLPASMVLDARTMEIASTGVGGQTRQQIEAELTAVRARPPAYK